MKKQYVIADVYNAEGKITFKAKELYKRVFKGRKDGIGFGMIDVDEVSLGEALAGMNVEKRFLLKQIMSKDLVEEDYFLGKTFDNTIEQMKHNLVERIHYTRYVRQDKTDRNFTQVAVIYDVQSKEPFIRGLLYAEASYSKTAQMAVVTDVQLVSNEPYLETVSSRTR